ncbi:MAG: PAS domain-containing protein [Chloroflexi bacterium]|nr:PAS domain-containing protein [Chloroflexota bacterium]
MMQGRQRLGRRFRDLLDIIQIAENISVKLHNALDEAAIYQTVVDEFAQSGKYSGSILLLSDDGSRLHMAATSLFSSPAHGPAIEQAANIQLLGYAMDVQGCDVWRPVLEEGRTVHYPAAEVVRKLFPPPTAERIVEVMDYKHKTFVLAPLKRNGQIMGVLAMSSTTLTECLTPSVTNLALHISHALEMVAARRKQMEAMRALQESQATMQTLINASPEVILLMDREGKVLTGNHALAESLGYPLDEIRGKNVHDFFPPGVREEREARMREVLEGGKAIYFQDERAGRYFEHFLYPVFGAMGQVERIAVFARDVTERKRMEAELLQAEKLRTLGMLAGGIAHALRNPLAVISSCIQTLRDHPHDARVCAESVPKAQAAVERAGHIVDSLLQFARPTPVQMMAIDLESVLSATLELLVDHLCMRKVTVRRRWRTGLPLVHGNAHLLQQVFTELMLNACNAMPDGGTITITARVPRSDWVEVCFRDTGQGIPPEYLPKIFDPFFTTRPESEGIGLGLSIAQRIIQQHGGSIKVQSQLGKGSVFAVRLRRAAKEA